MEAAACNLDGLAAGGDRVHCCHVLEALPSCADVPFSKSLLHFVFIFQLGSVYCSFDLSIDLLLFSFRASEKFSFSYPEFPPSLVTHGLLFGNIVTILVEIIFSTQKEMYAETVSTCSQRKSR